VERSKVTVEDLGEIYLLMSLDMIDEVRVVVVEIRLQGKWWWDHGETDLLMSCMLGDGLFLVESFEDVQLAAEM
jgi:hypothetical protein